MTKSRRAKPAGVPTEGLGRAVKVIRTAQGLDRKDLAKRSGLSYPYLAEIEQGKKAPSARALAAIADALDIRPSELLAAADSFVQGNETLVASIEAPFPAPALMAASPAAHSWFSTRRRSTEPKADAATRKSLGDQLLEAAEKLNEEDLRLVLEFAQRLSRSR